MNSCEQIRFKEINFYKMQGMSNWKCLPLIIFVFFSGNIYPHGDTNTIINERLEKSKHYFTQLNYFKSIDSAERALISSRQSGYSKGVAISSIYLAKALLEVGDYKSALNFLSEVETSPYFILDVSVQAETYRIKGKVYNTFEMHSLAEEQFKKQLLHSNSIENFEEKRILVLSAQKSLMEVYNHMKLNDSVTKYLGLQEQGLKRINGSKYTYCVGNTYCQIAKELIERNEFIKAKEYIDNSMKLHKKYNSDYLFDSLEAYGFLEETAGNIDLAEIYYQKALENVLHTENQKAISYYYKVLSDFYLKHKPHSDKGKYYYLHHNKSKDSIGKMNDGVLLDLYEHVLRDEQKIQKASPESFEYILIAIVMLSTAVIVYIQQNREKNKELIDLQSLKLSEHKKSVINLTNELSENKLEELIIYANTNSPEFLTAFQNLYPNVVEDLKKRNVNITTSTLGFCALTYLNFSTKEMATIQNVTIRAIQVRKNRIRNQFEIPSDIDFNIWMNENLGPS